jgi:fimbrial chaperone protein
MNALNELVTNLRRLAVAAALSTEFVSSVAHAATSVAIWPIDPVIESSQHAAALWLENRDTKPVTLQIRVVGWNQVDARDVYADQQDRVVSSPPMTVVPPGKRQLIRLTKLVDAAPGTEGAYRILIDEVPQPTVAGDESAPDIPAFGIHFQMHYSIPLFVDGHGIWTKEDPDHSRDGATAAQPVLRWRIEQAGGERWLIVTNRGQVHARLTAIAFDGNATQTDIERGLFGYVLPGSQMRWAIKDVPSGNAVKLIATVNGNQGVVIDPDTATHKH